MDDAHRGDVGTTSRGFTIMRLPDPQFDDDWTHIFVPDETKQRLLRYADRLVQARASDRRPPNWGCVASCCSPVHRERGSRASAAAWPTSGPASMRNRPLWSCSTPTRCPVVNVVAASGMSSTLFQHLDEVAATGRRLFILCDEIESLATDRTSVNPGTNPLDSLYAVNALIEQLDQFVRQHPNVLFVLTSNLPRFIDRAIGDRVDAGGHHSAPGCRATRLDSGRHAPGRQRAVVVAAARAAPAR